MKKTLIVGVGSILRGDDGVGPRVIDELEKGVLTEGVDLHGADISGMDLLKFFPNYERVIIIDAADMGEKPGTVKVFSPSEIEKADFSDEYSTHGMALLETLTLAESLDLDPEIIIIGVQPEHIDYDLELSESIRARIPNIIETVKGLL